MRNRWLSAVVATALAISPAVAAPLSGDVGSLAGLINAKSKSVGADIKVAKEKCGTNDLKVCSYIVEDGLWIIASSTPDKKATQSLLIYLATDDLTVAAKYIVLLGLLMAIYAPEASGEERAATMKVLVAGIGKRDKAEATLHRIQFAISVQPSLGTFTSVTRP